MSDTDTLATITIIALTVALSLVMFSALMVNMYLSERKMHYMWRNAYVDQMLNAVEIAAEARRLGIDRIVDDAIRDEGLTVRDPDTGAPE